MDLYSTKGDALEAPDGACLFRPGDEGRAFLILNSGAVRVEQINSVGRTIVLYRVEADDSCVLTTTCLLSDKPYPGYGYSKGLVLAVAISAQKFRNLLSTNARFQELVFRGFTARVGELTSNLFLNLYIAHDLHRCSAILAKSNGTVVSLKNVRKTTVAGASTREKVSNEVLPELPWTGRYPLKYLVAIELP